MKEFGYNTDKIPAGILGFGAVTAFVIWKSPELAIWILPFALIAAVFHFGYPLAKITIDEERIMISYLLPFRKPVTTDFVEVESYSTVKVNSLKKKNVLVYGLLGPKNGKSIMLSAAGTKNFEELSSILELAFPKDINEAEQLT